MKNLSISKLIKISASIILTVIILILPILHQSLPNYTSHFSILECIQSDIEEHQIQTPYFISTIFKSNNGTINKTVTTKISQTKQPITYQSYGMVKGNGTILTVYLKITNNWQSYKITSKYKGYEAKLIITNKEINPNNYKTIKILNVIDFNHKDNNIINKVNKMIREFNKSNID